MKQKNTHSMMVKMDVYMYIDNNTDYLTKICTRNTWNNKLDIKKWWSLIHISKHAKSGENFYETVQI